MVVLKECSNMFWGVTLDGGKRYSQTVEKPFHLSMAALESNPDVHDKKCHVQVMLQHETSEFLLCTLGHGNLLQQNLDLTFSSGETVTFFLSGAGIVHLTGSLLEEEEDISFADDIDDGDVDSDLLESSLDVPHLKASGDDSDDEDDSDFEPAFTGSKRKASKKSLKKSGKKMKITEVEDDDEYDSSFIDDEAVYEEEEESDEGNVDDEGDDDSLMREMEESSESPKSSQPSPRKKSKTLNISLESASDKKQKSPEGKESKAIVQEAKANGAGDVTTKKKKKKKKKKKNKAADENQEQVKSLKAETSNDSTTLMSPASSSKKRTVSGGIGVEDIKIGHGPEAKPGKFVSVYYVGTLAKNSKRFDSCQQGKPFRFRLGRGEVIKGWDTGLIGMKVGGKRKITVPPSQGYGNARQGPIPPGSTLTFDVELKAVS